MTFVGEMYFFSIDLVFGFGQGIEVVTWVPDRARRDFSFLGWPKILQEFDKKGLG